MRQIIRQSSLYWFVAIVITVLLASSSQATESDPYTYYQEGINATTIGEREQAFEKALELYLERYNTMRDLGEANGLLCYNIANCYFNIGQLAESIYYYRTAQKLRPRDERIAANLQQAMEKRGNGVDVEKNALLEDILIFHYKLSTKERLNLLVGCAILTSLFLLLLMFQSHIGIRYLTIILGVVTLSLTLSLTVEYYFPRHIGIVLKQTDVRKGTGKQFMPLMEHQIGEGSSLKVLSLSDGWFQVKLNNGLKGYVAEKQLRLLLP